MLRVVLVLLAVSLAGCFQGDPGPGGSGEASSVSLWGTVFIGDDPYPGVLIALQSPGGNATRVTDEAGSFRFDGLVAGPCGLTLTTPDGDEQTVSTSCPKQLTLRFAPPLQRPGGAVQAPRAPVGIDTFLLEAIVVDGAQEPMPGVPWKATRGLEEIASGRTGDDGLLRIEATAGPLDLSLTPLCARPADFRVVLEADTSQRFQLEQTLPAPLSIPPGTAAHDGPLDGVTITWGGVPGARGYEVTDGQQVVWTGALAWGDHTPSGPYRVRAVDPCGQATSWSDPVDAAPVTPVAHPDLLGESEASPEVSIRNFPVLDLRGDAIGAVPWRVVEGTGNCCENYIATSRQGWVMDFGGNTLFVSKDDGITWTEYTNHLIQICGEGAVVPGPAGDIYAMNWEFCLGSGTDGVWSMKYIAADDAWVEGSQAVHVPFFDRPWMSVGSGPHLDVTGAVAPVKAFIFTNFQDNLHGTGHGVSPDGVTYLPDTGLVAPTLGDSGYPPSLAFDPDADWTQPQIEAHGRSLDAGLHVMDLGLSGCQIVDAAEGRTCAPYDLPVRSMQRDSDGRLHRIAFSDEARVIRYSWSDDVGRTWQTRSFPYIPQIAEDAGREWDLKVHARLGRAALSMHTLTPDGGALDLVYMFRDVSGTPSLDQILQVGIGGGTGDSGVTADERYDFMSSGFFPDGRLALSFRDSTLDRPALAIGLTN